MRHAVVEDPHTAVGADGEQTEEARDLPDTTATSRSPNTAIAATAVSLKAQSPIASTPWRETKRKR